MSEITWLGVMLAGGLITFLTRLSFIALEGKYSPPERLKRALPLVPIAALSTLILPDLLLSQGALTRFDNPRLLAGGIAVLVAWHWKNATLTIVTGFIALFLLG
ncbi:MAG TPA: AzlD domain-containing protein [Rhodocyclaceae bacterium]|nr:AzlD domain-containing protein [Rhodocyclaceae bacterium]